MLETPENMQALIEEIRHVRDEVNLQIHLAAAEAKDEWEALEEKWTHFEAKAERVGHAAGEAAGEVGDALELLGEELRKGYHKIRDQL